MELDFSTTRHVFNPFLLTSALIPEPRAAFCQWFEDFGRRLAPADLGNVPLYVVDAALAGPGDTLGFARRIPGPCLSRADRPALERPRRMFRRGPPTGAGSSRHRDTERRGAKGRISSARLLHSPCMNSRTCFHSDRAFQSRVSARPRCKKPLSVVCKRPTMNCRTCDVAWVGHDGHFLRTVAHVEHRARALLGSPVQAYAVAGLLYGLSKAEGYRQALADEPAKLAGEPFTEIMQTRPPQSFIDLWQADLRAWRSRHEPLTKSQALAMEQGQTLFSK